MLAWCLHWGEDRSCSLTPPPPCPAFGATFSPFLAFPPREAAPGLGFIATSALCSRPATSPLSPAAAPRVPPSAPRRHPPAGRGRGRGRAGRPEPASKALMEAEGGGRAAAGKRGGRERSPAASPPSPAGPSSRLSPHVPPGPAAHPPGASSSSSCEGPPGAPRRHEMAASPQRPPRGAAEAANVPPRPRHRHLSALLARGHGRASSSWPRFQPAVFPRAAEVRRCPRGGPVRRPPQRGSTRASP